MTGAGAVALAAAALFFAATPVAADDTATASPDPSATSTADPSTPTPTPPPPPPVDVTTPPTTPPPEPPAAPPPAPLPDPTASITCTQITVDVWSPPDSGRWFASAFGRAEKGTPTFQPASGPLGGHFLYQQELDPGQAIAYIFELRAADGTVLWSRSGTTVTCAPEPRLKYAAPYRVEPVSACRKTLADVDFPSTPGITYSYDEWNAYARLKPGWIWDYDAFYPPHAWWISNSATSDVAWLPRSAFFMDAVGCPRYASVAPPMSQRPGAGSLSGAATAAAPPGATLTPDPSAAAAPAAAPTPRATASPSPAPAPTAAPSPSPSPTAAATASRTRAATTPGLATVGGAMGAGVLLVAGAFTYRLRHRHGLDTEGLTAVDDEAADDPAGD